MINVYAQSFMIATRTDTPPNRTVPKPGTKPGRTSLLAWFKRK